MSARVTLNEDGTTAVSWPFGTQVSLLLATLKWTVRHRVVFSTQQLTLVRTCSTRVINWVDVECAWTVPFMRSGPAGLGVRVRAAPSSAPKHYFLGLAFSDATIFDELCELFDRYSPSTPFSRCMPLLKSPPLHVTDRRAGAADPEGSLRSVRFAALDPWTIRVQLWGSTYRALQEHATDSTMNVEGEARSTRSEATDDGIAMIRQIRDTRI
jgi:hypothetical protein